MSVWLMLTDSDWMCSPKLALEFIKKYDAEAAK